MSQRLSRLFSTSSKLLLLLVSVFALNMGVVLADSNSQFNDICHDQSVSAANPSNPATSSPLCKDNPSGDPLTDGGSGILDEVTNIIALIAGVAAVIMIIVGGLMYILSGGESARINTAKNTILFAIIGIVVIVLARALIIYVVAQV